MGKNKYSISQNFITNKILIDKLIELSDIEINDTVIEIGTGKGHITERLSKKCKVLYSVEIDSMLYERTKTKLKDIENLYLLNMDFLKYQLPKNDKYKIFSNIPYSLTTEIIEKITRQENLPTDIWITMERGTSKRFMGNPRETLKSLMLKPFWNMETIYFFRGNDFHPRPSVDSIFMHMAKIEIPDINYKDIKIYESFLQHSFKWGLYGNNRLLSKKQISMALKLGKLPQLEDSTSISYAQWLCLFKCYKKFN